MCRFLVYKGGPILLSELLTDPDHSLIKQSYQAKERPEPLNGDGFGLGWYVPRISQSPCVFTSVTPAWGNRNLMRLASKVDSPLLFAHIRAASPGMMVSEANCHPFQYGNMLWMHNGKIHDFFRIKRRLRRWLRDDIYDWIGGTTDSEHAFGVFLNHLPPGILQLEPEVARRTMQATIDQLNRWSEEAGIQEPCTYNFAFTDGHIVMVTRYATKGEEPETLYYSQLKKVETVEGQYQLESCEEFPNQVIIASEPVTPDDSHWKKVPANHMLILTKSLEIEISPIL